MPTKLLMTVFSTLLFLAIYTVAMATPDDTVKIALNYPKTGPYSVQGLDQWRAAQLAIKEINASGGILGKQIEAEF